MKLAATFAFVLGLATTCLAQTPSYSVHWSELTAADFARALQTAQHVCVLPFGVVEKHGPTGPLGTDLLNVRYASIEAAKQEYAVVFPEYYFGQIFEARHQPGTLAYSAELQLKMLQETTAEMGRNGCRKIAIVNGHGGNNFFLQYFAQAQLESRKNYVVYAIMSEAQNRDTASVPGPSRPGVDGHGGEAEMSNVMASRPDLVHPDRAPQESGADLGRQDLPAGVFTGIGWYARFPNHYQGDAAGANAARGTAAMRARAAGIAAALRAIKADDSSLRLQNEFFDAAERPTPTAP